MNKLLVILLITLYVQSSAQTSIDTSKIESQRFEWEINLKTSDSTLSSILTEYKSRIFKEEYLSYDNGQRKKYLINVFEPKTDYLNRDIKKSIKVHYWSVLDAQNKFYYDRFGILDSVYFSYYIDSLKQISKSTIKKFDKKNRLKWLINHNGFKEVYKYDSKDNISAIEIYNDTILYEIRYFENGYLTEQKFPTRNKYRKKFTYEYDDKGHLLTRNDDDHFLWNYYYENSQLIRKEKIFKKKNIVVEYFIYEYDNEKRLKSKKEYKYRHGLIRLYKYEYK